MGGLPSILRCQKLCRPPRGHSSELGECRSEVTVDNGPASNSIVDSGCRGARRGTMPDHGDGEAWQRDGVLGVLGAAWRRDGVLGVLGAAWRRDGGAALGAGRGQLGVDGVARYLKVLLDKENAVLIGTTIDELVRDHPSLKAPVFDALKATLSEIEVLGLQVNVPLGTIPASDWDLIRLWYIQCFSNTPPFSHPLSSAGKAPTQPRSPLVCSSSCETPHCGSWPQDV
ncbi:hypothetical protein B0H14DRAFT_3621131 [Mycena olivaceomarginata]|nr:hypothetical protein B0H14DRAFT_3621131 [Mycena olivaceomarginata]